MKNHELNSNKQNKSDEYYTKEYAIIPMLKYLKPYKTIWCPFDKKESNYVSVLEKNGHKVIYSHIENGYDFLTYTPKENFDCILSNPPYSLRETILEKCFSLQKPFGLLINISGLFGSKKRFQMFSNNKFEMMVFNKRINYDNENGKHSPPFDSIYLCSKLLPSQFCFEEVNK